MKALLVSAAAIGLLSAAPAFAQAGPSSTANAGASAEIVAPIAVTKTADLDFGRLAAFASPADVSVDAGGTLSPSAPGMVISGSTGSAAAFDVTGAPSLAYSTTIPASVTLTGAGADMIADLSKDGGAAALSATGTDSFKVVGTLHVGGGQTPGAYAGSFDVSVQYN